MTLFTSLADIPVIYREVYVLYYQQQLTQQQISQQLNISLYAVRGRLSKAVYLMRASTGDTEIRKARKILLDNEH